MRGKALGMGSLVLIVSLSLIVFSGCGKKGEVRNQLTVTQAQKPSGPSAAGASQEQAKGERTEPRQGALQEQTLREQSLREESLRKGAEPAVREGVEKGKPQAPAAETEVLKELQIPDIVFEYDRFSLTAEAQAILKRHAPAFVKYREYKLLVEGHCDERGTAEYNLALGEERAAQTMKYLVSLGIEKERIKAISFGEEKPVDPGHDEAAWAKNRRAHFVVVAPGGKW
jgi:peptidoglycan-associated lipoprotein